MRNKIVGETLVWSSSYIINLLISASLPELVDMPEFLSDLTGELFLYFVGIYYIVKYSKNES